MNNEQLNMNNIKAYLSREDIQAQIKIAIQNHKNIGSNTYDKLKNQFGIKENSLIESTQIQNNQLLQKNNFQIKRSSIMKRSSIIRNDTNKEEVNFQVFLSSLDEFMNGDKNVYLTLGGVGDLLLLLAVCYNNEKAHIVFLANDESNKFAKKFLDYFNLKYIVHKNLMGTKFCNPVYNKITSHPNFTLSAHLADRCDYGDWSRNTDKYKNRLSLGTDWINLIGIKKRDKKYVIVCPSGSHKCEHRRRHLNTQEYNTVVKMYLKKGYEVITASSKIDLENLGIYQDKNCYWLTDSELINYRGVSQQIDFNTFLQIIISCDDLVSMDTWIKTFMALCGKSAHVIKTRFHSSYREIGRESCDHIFLNKDFWPKLKIHTYEDFIEYIKSMPSQL
jgi:hypothetical protein